MSASSFSVASFLSEVTVEYIAFVAVYVALGAIVEVFVTSEISQARTKMIYKQFWDSMPGLFVGVLATNVWRRVLDPISPYADYYTENPYSFSLLVQNVVVFLIVYDGVFYFGHRLLHTPRFYARFHKQHHYPLITTWAATALHPYEILLNVFGLHVIKFFTPIPFIVHNAMLLGTHFSGVIAHEENLDPYGHYLHHVKHNCNFSGYLPFWDWVFGTRDGDINPREPSRVPSQTVGNTMVDKACQTDFSDTWQAGDDEMPPLDGLDQKEATAGEGHVEAAGEGHVEGQKLHNE